MEVSSDSGFWECHEKGLLLVDHVCHAETWEGVDKAQKEQRVLDQKGRWNTIKKTERPLTCLWWRSDKPNDSASAREILMILKALVSMVSRWESCEAVLPAQMGEQYSIKLWMKALQVVSCHMLVSPLKHHQGHSSVYLFSAMTPSGWVVHSLWCPTKVDTKQHLEYIFSFWAIRHISR